MQYRKSQKNYEEIQKNLPIYLQITQISLIFAIQTKGK